MKTRLIALLIIGGCSSTFAQRSEPNGKLLFSFKSPKSISAREELLAKGWSYLLALSIMKENKNLEFNERLNLSSDQPAYVIELEPASKEFCYQVTVQSKQNKFRELLVDQLISYKDLEKNINKLSAKIVSVIEQLENKIDQSKINFCFPFTDDEIHNVHFNEKLKACLNEKGSNYSFQNQCGVDDKKYLPSKCRVIGKRTSSLINASSRLSPYFEKPGSNIKIELTNIVYPISDNPNIFDESGSEIIHSLCASISSDVNAVLSLEDSLMVRLSEVQKKDYKTTLQFIHRLNKLNKSEAALFLLSYLISSSPKIEEAYIEKGKILSFLGNYGESENNFRLALNANQESIPARLGLVKVLMSQRKYVRALGEVKSLPGAALTYPEINLTLGELYYAVGRSDKKTMKTAEEYFINALNNKGTESKAYSYLARIYSDNGEDNKAIYYYKKAISSDPADSISREKLAALYFLLGNEIEDEDNVRIIKYYDSAIFYDKTNAEFYSSKGYLLYQMDNLEGAIDSYKKMIQYDSTNSSHFFSLAYVYQEAEQDSLAIKYYSKSIELNPSNIYSLNNRSSLYKKLNRLDEALKDINKAIAQDPHYSLALYNKGTIYHDKKEYKNAEEWYSIAIAADSTYLNSYFNRGTVRYFLQNYELAAVDLSRYLRNVSKDKLNYDAYYYLGVCNYFNSEANQAVDNLSAFVSYEPDAKIEFWAYNYRGKAYIDLQQYEKAVNDLKTASQIKESYPYIYFDLALAYYRGKGDLDNAIANSRIGIKKTEEEDTTYLADLYSNLGWYLYKKGNWQEAFTVSERAIKFNPGLLNVRFNLGLISLNMGEIEKARNYYEEAVSAVREGRFDPMYKAPSKKEIVEKEGMADLQELKTQLKGQNSNGNKKLLEDTLLMISFLESQVSEL